MLCRHGGGRGDGGDADGAVHAGSVRCRSTFMVDRVHPALRALLHHRRHRARRRRARGPAARRHARTRLLC